MSEMGEHVRRLAGRRQVRRPGAPRTIVHKVKVTAETEEKLVARAARRGNLSIPRLLVESALAGSAEVAEKQAEQRMALAAELYRVSRLLGKVGVNVNQIARATNASGEVQEDLHGAMLAVQRVCARVDGLLDSVGAP